MFKGMRSKFVGAKDGKKDAKEPAGAPSTSSSSSRPLSVQSSKLSSGPSRPASAFAAREKPPLPASLSEAAMLAAYAENLPSFRDVPASEKQNLFVQKLHLCAFTFDFADASKHVKEKETKRQTLLELVEYANTGQGKFTEAVSEDITFMLASNLFRSLPPPRASESDGADAEEEEPTLESAWPHLQIVYEFLLRYVVSNDTDAKVAKRHIDQGFVLRLLELFDSEDPRERDYLKTILHRIYGKFMVHRPFIRKAINHVFFKFIYETERHNGVAELLEILGSIINGFALPLKDEHKMFLSRALMPLHKPKCVALYHQQLAYCVTQFVEKDPKLAEAVIGSLLRFWPVTNSQKEVLFLGELEEVLELTQQLEFSRVLVPLFRQLARCLSSAHFQVAERALFLWNNDQIIGLVALFRQQVLPIVLPALEANMLAHWNPAVHGLTSNVRKMFQELDEPLFDECLRRYKEEQESAERVRNQRDRQWAALTALAEKKAPGGGGRPLLAHSAAA